MHTFSVEERTTPVIHRVVAEFALRILCFGIPPPFSLLILFDCLINHTFGRGTKQRYHLCKVCGAAIVAPIRPDVHKKISVFEHIPHLPIEKHSVSVRVLPAVK